MDCWFMAIVLGSFHQLFTWNCLFNKCVSDQEQGSISGIFEIVKAYTNSLQSFREDHSGQAVSIEEKAREAFQQRYMDYEPSGTTPVRSESDVPSKVTIESLRAMPMETLLEEFRENHSYDSFDVKELKPSLIPRSPLTRLNLKWCSFSLFVCVME